MEDVEPRFPQELPELNDAPQASCGSYENRAQCINARHNSSRRRTTCELHLRRAGS